MDSYFRSAKRTIEINLKEDVLFIRKHQDTPDAYEFKVEHATSLTDACSSSLNTLLAGDFGESKDSIEKEDINKNSYFNRFCGYNFSHSSNLQNHVRDTFKLEKIHETQLSPINAVLLGHNCFVTMSSASGKSLIYQLPAVIVPGVTVVISPFISLISDQVTKLNLLGINAKHLKKGELYEEIPRDVEADKPKVKIIYLTPEKIAKSYSFLSQLKNLYERHLLERIVIDEAQCIKEFGGGFREDYSTLHNLKDLFPRVPWTLLSGTISFESRADIIKQLHLDDSIQFFSSDIDRSNLRYEVFEKTAVVGIVKLINMKYDNMSGIIYCLYKHEVEQIVNELRLHGITASPYHSDTPDKDRQTAQTKWMADKVQVICATLAFGMGIDKPNVRFIIHASLPRSIEQYYADCGHAGRDGETADCILYYDNRDVIDYLRIVRDKDQEIDDIKKMVSYCKNRETCRRKLLLNHFGESFLGEKYCSEHMKCDNCQKKP